MFKVKEGNTAQCVNNMNTDRWAGASCQRVSPSPWAPASAEAACEAPGPATGLGAAKGRRHRGVLGVRGRGRSQQPSRTPQQPAPPRGSSGCGWCCSPTELSRSYILLWHRHETLISSTISEVHIVLWRSIKHPRRILAQHQHVRKHTLLSANIKVIQGKMYEPVYLTFVWPTSKSLIFYHLKTSVLLQRHFEINGRHQQSNLF